MGNRAGSGTAPGKSPLRNGPFSLEKFGPLNCISMLCQSLYGRFRRPRQPVFARARTRLSQAFDAPFLCVAAKSSQRSEKSARRQLTPKRRPLTSAPHQTRRTSPLRVVTGPGGGIGRRARFRSVCREAWRFESSPGHHFPTKSRVIFKRYRVFARLHPSRKQQLHHRTPETAALGARCCWAAHSSPPGSGNWRFRALPRHTRSAPGYNLR